MSRKITRREFAVENMLDCVRFCSHSGAFPSGFAGEVFLFSSPRLRQKA